MTEGGYRADREQVSSLQAFDPCGFGFDRAVRGCLAAFMQVLIPQKSPRGLRVRVSLSTKRRSAVYCVGPIGLPSSA
jgi:hypothetical protein